MNRMEYPEFCAVVLYARRDERDPFFPAFTLRIRQPAARIVRHPRAVNRLTAEAIVSAESPESGFQRSVFASRIDDAVVLRLVGRGKPTSESAFAALPARTEQEKRVVADGVKSSEQGVRDGLPRLHTDYARENPFNPNQGHAGFGRVIARGGTREDTGEAIEPVPNPAPRQAHSRRKIGSMNQGL